MRLTSGHDRGSVLLLVPAAFLVVVVLAAICVDQALVLLRQRQAVSVATDIANDLATAAYDETTFRESGQFELDADRAVDLGHRLVASSDVGPFVEDAEIRVTAGGEVVVALQVRVDYVFAGALPGVPASTSVRARAAGVALSAAD